MADLTVYHNPNCSTSKTVLAMAQDAGADVEVVQYLKTPPSRERLTWLVEHLDGPVADLVRKDPFFKELGLDAADYTEPAAVVELLLEYPRRQLECEPGLSGAAGARHCQHASLR